MGVLSEILNTDVAFDYIQFEGFAYLIVVLFLFWFGKLANDLITSYSINEELTHKDNKALAVSYVGYLIGQGLIILGVLEGEGTDLINDLIQMVIWSIVGIVLLNLSRVINDKIIFSKFDNAKEIIQDKNIGTGAIQFGSYVGTAFILRAILTGESLSFKTDLLYTAVFFIVGQVGFFLFARIYQLITRYDLHAEIEKGNVAAGVSFGTTLVAIGILLSHSIDQTYSIAAFGIWFINGLSLIIAGRFLADKFILPNHKLDAEIQQDQNWGVALIEGGSAIVIALLLNASFS